MSEARAIAEAVNPNETLLALDAMTGQDAVAAAAAFHEATAWASRWGWLVGFAALGLAKAPGVLGPSAGGRLRGLLARGPLRLAVRLLAAR